jgi:hypothetical protein
MEKSMVAQDKTSTGEHVNRQVGSVNRPQIDVVAIRQLPLPPVVWSPGVRQLKLFELDSD